MTGFVVTGSSLTGFGRDWFVVTGSSGLVRQDWFVRTTKSDLLFT